MTIRPGTTADTDRLVTMATGFLAATAYGALFQADRARITALVATCLEHGIALVAEVEGEIVGMIGAVPLQHPWSGEVYLEEQAWWVEPRYRHGTIGPRLVQAVHTWAREQGIPVVKMGAPAGTDVGAFYERLGYHAVETAYVLELT